MQNRYTLLFFLLAFATTLGAQTSFFPVAVCSNQVNVAVGDDCVATITADMIDNGSSTALGTLSLSVSPNILTIGRTVVTMTADNGFTTRRCFSSVIVEDKTPPVISCRSSFNFTINDPTLLPDVLDAYDVTGGMRDNCYIDEAIVAVRSLTYYGSTAYRLTVTDQSGNQSTCQGIVNVRSPYYSGEVCTAYGDTQYEYIQYVGFSSPTINQSYGSGDNGGKVFFLRENRLRAGDALTLSYAPGFPSTKTFREYWRFYLDKNRDGDWNDAGETIHEWNGYGANNATIRLPGSFARYGISRLRVVMSYGGYKAACATGFYGEVEDYAVRLLPWWSSAAEGLAQITDKSAVGNPAEEYLIEVPEEERIAPPARFAAEVFPARKVESVKVFPNPAVAGSTIRIDLGARTQVQQLVLRSIVGKVITERSVAKGLVTPDFPLPATLKAGIYLLSGTGADGAAIWNQRVLVR